jgi:putative nucleotidyltransferase with HDIG domain
VALFLVVGTWALMPRLTFVDTPVSPGLIAQRQYVATRDLMVPDDVTTADRQKAAREGVLAVYDRDSDLERAVDQGLAALFSKGREWAELELPNEEIEGSRSSDLAPHLEEITGLRISEQDFRLLVALDFRQELEDAMRGASLEALGRGIIDNRALLVENRATGVTLRNLATGEEQVVIDLFEYLEYPAEVGDLIDRGLRVVDNVSARQRAALVAIMVANVTPNVFPNRTETLAREDQASSETAPVFESIQEGQVIARKGDRLTAGAVRAIDTQRGDQSFKAQLLPLLGNVLLLALISAVIWAGVGRERIPHKTRGQLLSENLILLSLMIVLARIGIWISEGLGGRSLGFSGADATSYIYAIPVASLAVLVAMLYSRNMAILISVVYSILVARLAGDESLALAIYTLAGSLGAIYALDRFPFRQRFALARVGMMIGLVNVTAILLVTALSRNQRATGELLSFDVLCGLLGGLLVAATASFMVPILEALFAITTDLRLIELSNTNLPLLRRLAFEAPGSFQHSLMVANLAKSGCSAIDADSTLAYTASLYHDIGKIHRPEYFIENQHAGKNPHDKVSPSMSALVLVGHIKDGLDLAMQYRLPRPILDAVEQHHGTRLITFFYRRALEQQEEGAAAIPESDYRYPGPRPQSRVMGVLMLADGVEAASRTLVDPTPMTIRSVIEKIFEDCVKDGQLDETDLTLSDLNEVSDAFFHVLSNIFHRRVDYPGFNFEERRGAAQDTESAGRP